MLLLLFATCSLSPQVYHELIDGLTWHPNMDLGNSVAFRNNNMVDNIKLGAKLKIADLPHAKCSDLGWGWSDKDAVQKIQYETYLDLTAGDLCGRKGAQQPAMLGGLGGMLGGGQQEQSDNREALGTPCIQAKKEKDLLTKMSQAVKEVFTPYDSLIKLCKDKIYDDEKAKNEKCEPKLQDFDVLKNECKLSYEKVKDNLDLFTKADNLDFEKLKKYTSFENEVKTVAQAAFLKAGGVCLSPIANKERVDWNKCKIVSNMEADQLLKETGASIVIFIATLVWGLVLAALIWASLNAYKALQKRRQGEQLLDGSA